MIEELFSQSSNRHSMGFDLGISSNTGRGDSRLNQIQNWEGLLKSVWTVDSILF